MKTKNIIYVAVSLLVLVGAIFIYTQSMKTSAVDSSASQADDMADIVPLELDMETALKPRVLGDDSAPIKIAEHASFTCSHCGKFHKDTFEQLKAEYIDTGKAYLVFSDFPLNGPALHASMVGRCIAEDQYFDYVHQLFSEQEHWAYDSNYLEYLKAAAGAHGLSENDFRACLKNEDLREGLLTTMKAVQTQWNVRSTPSFVINNKAVISGALAYDAFKQEVENAVNGKQDSAADDVSSNEPIETLDYPDTAIIPPAEVQEPSSEVTETTEEATKAEDEHQTALEELKADIEALQEDAQQTLEKVSDEATQSAIVEEAADNVDNTAQDIEAVEGATQEIQENLEDVKETLDEAIETIEETVEETQPDSSELTPMPESEPTSEDVPNGQ